MPHLIEPAASGRSRCRGCGQTIERGALRLGERLPNPFAEGELTVWLHLACAAYKRPETFLEALVASSAPFPDREKLELAARESLTRRRLPRIDGAERAPGGQAKCRHCREPIARGAWRVRLAYYEEGRFAPGGFVHLECREGYFDGGDILDRLLHFSRELGQDDREALGRACVGGPASP